MPQEGGIMFFISQLGEQDCAFACLKMMLANYNNDRNYLFIPNPYEGPLSFKDVQTTAKEYGMNLRGIKVATPDELFKCKKFPIMVTLQKRKDMRHSVLVLKANRRAVTIFDPEVGKRKVNSELFFKEWSYRAIVVESFTKSKCQITFPDFISKKDKIILPIIQFFSGISLLLGTYFLSDSSLFFLPVIFIAAFVVSEIVFRTSLVNAMRRMDDNIFAHSFKLPSNQSYMDAYKTIEKYRQISLTMAANFINAMLISIFIIVILVMNDLVNLVYVSLPVALAFIESFFYNPFFKNKEIQIVEREQEINDVENDFQFRVRCSDTHNIAYQLGLNKNIFNYVEIASMIAVSISVMAITSSINITYLIFYLCIMSFLKSNICRLLEFSSESEEFDFIKAKLLNYLSIS